jgi:hypothetical protein
MAQFEIFPSIIHRLQVLLSFLTLEVTQVPEVRGDVGYGLHELQEQLRNTSEKGRTSTFELG